MYEEFSSYEDAYRWWEANCKDQGFVGWLLCPNPAFWKVKQLARSSDQTPAADPNWWPEGITRV